ncbi:MAG TPA: acyltransferase family protein, partial [Candidatus Acidoferrales bacterium]|nr:acyltransferase family protein [Candidatus Acidoferrales bacterium]
MDRRIGAYRGGTFLNQLRGRPVNVDLIRAIAMVGVLLLHAAGRFPITPQEINQLSTLDFLRWSVVDVYQSVAVPLGVPLFLMLTGALLLQPQKKDTLTVFFKKRWTRIGWPSVFWTSAYFAWDFLVQSIPFTAGAIAQGILNGAYTQMWYLYLLVGLYLLTPIMRIFISHADEGMIKYFILIWILGVAILPFLELFSVYRLNSNVFALTGYVGFFVLGSFLSTVHARRRTLAFFLVLGIALTAVGTYSMAAMGIGNSMYFFQQYFSPTVILAAVAAFLLLMTIQPATPKADGRSSKIQKLIKCISVNTLGIFFIHVMIIESIQLGYLGFAL